MANPCDWKDNAFRWAGDIRLLGRELPKLHKNLFFKQPRETFMNDLDCLINDIMTYKDLAIDDLTIAMKLSSIVASLGDAHTIVVPPMMTLLPFKCYWFSEGLFILSAPWHKDIVHCKLLSINQVSVDDIITILRQTISHENRSFLLSQLPYYLQSAEVLYGLGIIDGARDIIVKLQSLDGHEFSTTVSAVSRSAYQSAAAEETNIPGVPQQPRYMQHPNLHYWKEILPDHDALYIKYNRCRNMPEQPMDAFYQEIKDDIMEKDIKRLVFDFRNNGGGDSTLLMPMIRWLGQTDPFRKKRGLYVIVGRDTFSSALLNVYAIKQRTKAVFIGEPTGGKPNTHGEVLYLTLKHSGLAIRYSTAYYELIKDDLLDSFYPDILCEVTMADYLAGKDPCLAFLYQESIGNSLHIDNR